MDIELVGNLFMFAGGIGMFLYGMNIMAETAYWVSDQKQITGGSGRSIYNCDYSE